jgi:molybdopterin-guanine dinucleotide biosynthesis protein A
MNFKEWLKNALKRKEKKVSPKLEQQLKTIIMDKEILEKRLKNVKTKEDLDDVRKEFIDTLIKYK